MTEAGVVVFNIPGLEMTLEDMGGGTDGELEEDEEATLGARKVPRGGGRGAGALRLSVPEELEAILGAILS